MALKKKKSKVDSQMAIKSKKTSENSTVTLVGKKRAKADSTMGIPKQKSKGVSQMPQNKKNTSKVDSPKGIAMKKKKPKIPFPIEDESKDSDPTEEEPSSKSLDEFLETWSDDDESDMSDEEMDQEDEESDDDVNNDEASAKRYLSSLQSKDPEFYKFLEGENDQEILNFDQSSSDADSEDDEEKDSCHKPDTNGLEVASDESDFEMEEDEPSLKKKKKKYNIDLLNAWAEELSSKEVSLDVITSVAGAFKDALKTVDEGIMMEGALFNAIVRTCVSHFEPGLIKYLKRTKNFKESPKWNKVNKTLKSYTTDLVKLLGVISDPAVLAVLLKHVHAMVIFYPCLPKSCKLLIKELIRIWSTSDEETLRILSFMCILRLVQRSMKTEEGESLFENTLKSMYMAFVKNSKFVSPSSRPGIAFMRRSLSELMNLNQEVSYQHAFVYLRQLAIHLRNALTLQKKDIYKTVYNWQFVNSLHLWATLFGTAVKNNPNSVLESLIHPLIQVMTGSIGLIYTTKYYPLRFHLCKIMMDLSNDSGKFIPLLSYYTDILRNYNFNKKSKKHSMKPLDFNCILRLSKPQLMENGFKDAAIDQVYGGMLELLSNHSHKICYPELATPAVFTLKAFLRDSKAMNYSKKMKQLLDKLSENSRWIEQRRKSVAFGIGSPQEIQAWEMKSKVDCPPLIKFFTGWKKIKIQETLKAEVKKIETKEGAHDYVPKINAKKKLPRDEEDDFQGDILAGEDDDIDDVERFELKDSDRKRKREEDESEEDDVDSDDEENAPPLKKKQLTNGAIKAAFPSVNGEAESSEDEDEVQDLNLEDLDSEEEDSLDEEEDDLSGEEEENSLDDEDSD